MKRILTTVLAVSILITLFAAVPTTSLAAGKGDVNGDNLVNTSDVRKVMLMAINDETPSQKQLWWGDYNINNQLDTTDARMLLSNVIKDADSAAINYAAPTGKDWWGDKSIAVLGDSISFGVGAADPLPENCYVSFVKKAVQLANGGNMNYGFTSAYPTAWTNPKAEEIHGWPERSTKSDGSTAWICDNNENGNRLVSVGMTSTTPWSTLTYTLREPYANEYEYFCVYYHKERDATYFAVADGNGGEVADINGSKAYINTASSFEITERTAFYRLADCPKDSNGLPQIILCHDGTDKAVTITGIGYYKDISGNTPTFNSFTRGGLSLVDVGDYVLQQAASADTLILGLGYNDFCFNHARVNNGEFKAKIDRLIELCNKNGTNVIVNDYAWNNPVYSANWIEAQAQANATVESELRRFAKETGGIYVDQQALLGDAIINDLNTDGDGVHPSTYGHKLMAGNIIDAMGLWWTEAWA